VTAQRTRNRDRGRPRRDGDRLDGSAPRARPPAAYKYPPQAPPETSPGHAGDLDRKGPCRYKGLNALPRR